MQTLEHSNNIVMTLFILNSLPLFTVISWCSTSWARSGTWWLPRWLSNWKWPSEGLQNDGWERNCTVLCRMWTKHPPLQRLLHGLGIYNRRAVCSTFQSTRPFPGEVFFLICILWYGVSSLVVMCNWVFFIFFIKVKHVKVCQISKEGKKIKKWEINKKTLFECWSV